MPESLWNRIPHGEGLLLSAIRPTRLKCEYMDKPICLDHPIPRFSWEIEGEGRSLFQKAYRILVGTSPTLLEENRNSSRLWDSSWVESEDTTLIPYSGVPLISRQECFWMVMVRDESGEVTRSDIQEFAMGLMTPADWKASWIGIPTPQPGSGLDFEGTSWIWTEPGAKRAWFRKSFPLAGHGSALPGMRGAGRPFLESAILLLAGDSWYGLYVNGSEVARGGYWPTSHHIDISDYLVEGTNTIAVEARADSANAGIIGRLDVRVPGSCPIIDTDASWLASPDETVDWMEPGFDDSQWTPARVVARYGEDPWGRGVKVSGLSAPSPYLRRAFRVTSPVRRAILYSTALGVYELRLNGSAVSPDLLAPGWTDYSKRIQYQAYDITEFLRVGDNCLGAVLGDGWFAGNISIVGRHYYGRYPLAFLAQLEMELEDGSTQRICTDEGWSGTFGPILRSDMQNGEVYDASLELVGWSEPSDNGSDPPGAVWIAAEVSDPPKGTLVAQVGPGIRPVMELDPISITSPRPGMAIVDMGQNMVGRVRLSIPPGFGGRGHLIRLRFGEMLQADGTLYTSNLRSAQQTDTYRMKGDAGEDFEPRFTFHGFRYVEVTGFPGDPKPEYFKGVVLQSDLALTGDFGTSNPMVDRLYGNILWGQRGNFVGLPTDCPQRDERMGWTGDTQVFAATACYNMDSALFYTKWMRDLADAQFPDGRVADVVPYVSIVGGGHAAWGDAATIVPWTVYLMYGDTRILEESYPAAKAWVDWLQATSDKLIRPAEGYGDWLSIDADTPKDLLGTAFFAYSAGIVGDMARILGVDEDALRYASLAGDVRDAFRQRFTDGRGKVAGDTQTGYLLALRFRLIPDEYRDVAMDYLIGLIDSRKGHLSTGFVGAGLLCPVLSEGGRDDTAYRLVLQDTYPSWGYSIRNGATTVWERWNSYTAEDGFGDVGMNSFNHYSLGAVGEWLMGYAGGIRPCVDDPGFRTVIVDPRIPSCVPGIDRVRVGYVSAVGPITVGWSMGAQDLDIDVAIPQNTRALIHLPSEDPDSISESGMPLSSAHGVEVLGVQGHKVLVRTGGGTYRFCIRRCE